MFNINKVLESIKNIFIERVVYYENCLYCNKKLTGSQRKFCSTICCSRYHNTTYSPTRNNDKRIRRKVIEHTLPTEKIRLNTSERR